MSSQLISHNTRRLPKEARAATSTDADIDVWHCANVASEAQIVAKAIRRAESKGVPLHQIAVLYRANHQSLPLQLALIMQDVPYHCRQEDNLILSKALRQIVDLMALSLKFGADGRFNDRQACQDICECYFRFKQDARAHRLHRAAERGGIIAAAERFATQGDSDFTMSFWEAVTVLRRSLPPGKMIEAIGQHFKSVGGLIGTLEDAVENHLPLGELIEIANKFDGTVTEFVDKMDTLLDKARELYHKDEADAVNLLTYFRAKGRQWQTVMLPGVNQKIIPHAKAPLEEERRLFYVAVTRPSRNLVISYVRNSVRQRVEPSCFLSELGLGLGSERRAT